MTGTYPSSRATDALYRLFNLSWHRSSYRQRAHFLNNRGTVLTAERRLGLARHDFEQALSLGAGNDAEFRAGPTPGFRGLRFARSPAFSTPGLPGPRATPWATGTPP